MANGRPPSDMEISLLVQVARECDPAAQAQGYGPGTGLGWVLAAIWEAVNSGSQFVAPKRIAAICDRWVIEGFGSDNRANPERAPDLHAAADLADADDERRTGADPASSRSPIPRRCRFCRRSAMRRSRPPRHPARRRPRPKARRLWEQVMRRLEGVLHPDALQRWFTERARHGNRARPRHRHRPRRGCRPQTRLVSRPDQPPDERDARAHGRCRLPGDAPLRTPSAPRRAPSPTVHPGILSPVARRRRPPWSWPDRRRHPAHSRRPSRVRAPRAAAAPDEPPQSADAPPRRPGPTPPVVRQRAPTVPRCGDRADAPANLGDGAARLAEPDERRDLRGLDAPRRTARHRPGRHVVIGARNRVQRERLEGQYLADLTAVLGKILDRPVGMRVVIIGETDARSTG